MDQNKKIALVLLLSTVVFIAVSAFIYQENSTLRSQLAGMTSERDTYLARAGEQELELGRLRNRKTSTVAAIEGEGTNGVTALEQLLDQRDAEIATMKQQVARTGREPAAAGRNDRRSDNNRGDMQERMERLREENPEAYQRMQTMREEMRKRREETTAKRDDYLKNLDLNALPEKQREVIQDFRTLMAANQELMASMETGEMNRDAMREMMENSRAINDISTAVRDILLGQLGQKLGTDGNSLANGVKDIMDITASGFGGNFGGGGRRSGGRRSGEAQR